MDVRTVTSQRTARNIESYVIRNASIMMTVNWPKFLLKTDGSSLALSKETLKNINRAKKLIGCKEIDWMEFNKFTIWWDDNGRLNGSPRNFEAEKLIADDPENYKFEVFGNVIVIPGEA